MKTINTQHIIKFFFIAIVAVFTAAAANAQSAKKNFRYDITVNGSSNIHDWSMKGSGSGEGIFDLSAAAVDAIQPITLTIPVKSIKSDEGLLNSRAYSAVGADKNPNMVFKVTSAKGSGTQLTINGLLTFAGATRQVAMTANTKKNADGSFTITGSKKIKLSEFGVKAPSYMLGAMKVYDDLTINYTVKI